MRSDQRVLSKGERLEAETVLKGEPPVRSAAL